MRGRLRRATPGTQDYSTSEPLPGLSGPVGRRLHTPPPTPEQGMRGWKSRRHPWGLAGGCREEDTYCRKIALSYAHSTDSNSIGEDLNALSDSASSVSVLDPSEPRTPVGSRKASRNIFLEDDFAWQRYSHLCICSAIPLSYGD